MCSWLVCIFDYSHSSMYRKHPQLGSEGFVNMNFNWISTIFNRTNVHEHFDELQYVIASVSVFITRISSFLSSNKLKQSCNIIYILVCGSYHVVSDCKQSQTIHALKFFGNPSLATLLFQQWKLEDHLQSLTVLKWLQICE